MTPSEIQVLTSLTAEVERLKGEIADLRRDRIEICHCDICEMKRMEEREAKEIRNDTGRDSRTVGREPRMADVGQGECG